MRHCQAHDNPMTFWNHGPSHAGSLPQHFKRHCGQLPSLLHPHCSHRSHLRHRQAHHDPDGLLDVVGLHREGAGVAVTDCDGGVAACCHVIPDLRVLQSSGGGPGLGAISSRVCGEGAGAATKSCWNSQPPVATVGQLQKILACQYCASTNLFFTDTCSNHKSFYCPLIPVTYNHIVSRKDDLLSQQVNTEQGPVLGGQQLEVSLVVGGAALKLTGGGKRWAGAWGCQEQGARSAQ